MHQIALRGDNARMLRLIGIVITIGLADSLNPTTVAPALYLASAEQARERVLEYTIAVFSVYLVGGLVIALGPGQLLLSLLPHPSPNTKATIEVIVGVAMIMASVVLWRHRNTLSKRQLPQPDPGGKSSWVLGASITAVELPTAFPYFAAIAAIVGFGLDPGTQLALLVLFNVCFVLPLIAIVATLWIAGEDADDVLTRFRDFLQRNWPVLLAGAALLAGVFVVTLGATAFVAKAHGKLGSLARHLRHLMHIKA